MQHLLLPSDSGLQTLCLSYKWESYWASSHTEGEQRTRALGSPGSPVGIYMLCFPCMKPPWFPSP